MGLKNFSLKNISRKSGILFLLLLCAAILRLVNLGYSDYQGDETQALYIPKGQTFSQFVLSQRRAPGQFVVTMLVRGLSKNYSSEFVTRLPFAIFSIFSCYVFFIFVKKLLNEKAAVYSLIFFVTNGLFVALSRIVQYQSLVMLLMFLVLYQLLLLLEDNKIKHLYIAGILWGLSFLVHSDSVYFFPMALFLVLEWIKKNKMDLKITFKKMIIPVILGLSVMLIFYGPYLLNLPTDTLNYWKGRIEGTHQANVVNNSRYLFEVYQPIYTSHLYIIASVVGAFILMKGSKSINLNSKLGLISWFLFSFLFMEFAVEVPGTHIYTYLIPATIFMGVFFSYLEDFVSHHIKKILPLYYFAVIIMFFFLFFQSYAIFVDHKREYPWQTERFLVWDFPSLNPVFKLSLFGFPYNRNWEGISEYITGDGRSFYYASNEKRALPRYYLPDYYFNDSSRAGYYIQIIDPQSGTNPIINERSAKWIENNEPEKVFYRGEKVLAKIYFMPDSWR